MNSSRGFTLIELLMAMAIFAVIGTVLFIQIHTVTRAKEKVEYHARQLTQLQKAMQWMARDIEQTVQRPHRNEFGDTEGALIGDTANIAFTRAGWVSSPAVESPRSELQRVRYQWQDQQLIRTYWPFVDGNDQAQSLVLLKKVSALNWQYWYRLPDQSVLQSSNIWPLAHSEDVLSEKQLPMMIELNMTVENFGSIRRLFLLPQAVDWRGSHGS